MPIIITIGLIIVFFYVKNNPSILIPASLILLAIIGLFVLYFNSLSKRTRKCNICNATVPYLESITSKKTNAVICYNCLTKAGYKPSQTIDVTASTVIEKIQAKETIMNYNYTHIIGDYLAINQNEKTWSPFPYKKVYNYSDLIDYEIIENGKTIYSSISSKGAGGIGRAIIGGLLFGGAGAVVGATTAKSKTETESNNLINSINIKITINDMDIRNIIIDMGYNGPNDTYQASIVKNTVQDIASTLDIIKNYNMQKLSEQNNSINNSQADEIYKFKKLLDNGAITQEEYEKKKKQLLNI